MDKFLYGMAIAFAVCALTVALPLSEEITELTDNQTRLRIELKVCEEEKPDTPRKLFDAVSENTGVQFNYDNQTHQGVVRELLSETFRGRE